MALPGGAANLSPLEHDVLADQCQRRVADLRQCIPRARHCLAIEAMRRTRLPTHARTPTRRANALTPGHKGFPHNGILHTCSPRLIGHAAGTS
eukprot:9021788-Pyramimonas_sp.AAC.1